MQMSPETSVPYQYMKVDFYTHNAMLWSYQQPSDKLHLTLGTHMWAGYKKPGLYAL